MSDVLIVNVVAVFADYFVANDDDFGSEFEFEFVVVTVTTGVILSKWSFSVHGCLTLKWMSYSLYVLCH